MPTGQEWTATGLGAADAELIKTRATVLSERTIRSRTENPAAHRGSCEGEEGRGKHGENRGRKTNGAKDTEAR